MSATQTPEFREAFRVFAKIGLLSFGGPTAQIALMHRILVEENKWLSEQQYLNALSFCMLLPGPEAMQLATYSGWRLNGWRGGLMAGLLFVLPGACVVLALSAIYAAFGNLPFMEALFFGVKAAVLVIVIEALLRIAKRALKGAGYWLIAALSFIGIFFLALPFPVIIIAAALTGFFLLRDGQQSQRAAAFAAGQFNSTLKTIALWLAIWLAPLAILAPFFGASHVLTQLFWFFSKLAVVTFGGAYAVLAYMAQDAVQTHQWLSAGAMLDGLGLAETTPGPLILVTQFVGYLAGWNKGGWILALSGALIAIWATFAPCFLWIFAGAPYIEWITAQPRLRSALNAISAAVAGVILNLSLWFALHVFFARVTQQKSGPFNFWTPDITSFDWKPAMIAIVSGVFLLQLHWGIARVLAIAALLGLVLRFAPFA